METQRDYTVNYREYGAVTVPAGPRTTHKTACGIDPAYNFVDSFAWVEPYPDGTPKHGLLHDLAHYGLNVPAEYLIKITREYWKKTGIKYDYATKAEPHHLFNVDMVENDRVYLWAVNAWGQMYHRTESVADFLENYRLTEDATR